MKKINTYSIGRILFITGIVIIIFVVIYGCFIAHPLLGVFSIGAWTALIGTCILNIEK